jgi:hypothetical protein
VGKAARPEQGAIAGSEVGQSGRVSHITQNYSYFSSFLNSASIANFKDEKK